MRDCIPRKQQMSMPIANRRNAKCNEPQKFYIQLLGFITNGIRFSYTHACSNERVRVLVLSHKGTKNVRIYGEHGECNTLCLFMDHGWGSPQSCANGALLIKWGKSKKDKTVSEVQ